MASPGRLAAFDTPNVRRVLAGAAVLGLALGIQTLVLHLSTDPLADVHAYYDAGARLNAGLPLYDQPATTNDNEFYRYPPLLAIVFRPLALLPFEVAAAIWEAFLVVCLALTIVRLGLNRRTWIVLGMLALPILWSLAIGQAQVVVTLLMALGAPWAIALGAHLKIFPALAAIWWLGRRDVRSFAWFMAWLAALGVAAARPGTGRDAGVSGVARAGAGRQRREPVALRVFADRVGRRTRGRDRRRVAPRADALRLGGCGRALGPGDAAAPHLPALDARRGAPGAEIQPAGRGARSMSERPATRRPNPVWLALGDCRLGGPRLAGGPDVFGDAADRCLRSRAAAPGRARRRRGAVAIRPGDGRRRRPRRGRPLLLLPAAGRAGDEPVRGGAVRRDVRRALGPRHRRSGLRCRPGEPPPRPWAASRGDRPPDAGRRAALPAVRDRPALRQPRRPVSVGVRARAGGGGGPDSAVEHRRRRRAGPGNGRKGPSGRSRAMVRRPRRPRAPVTGSQRPRCG